MTHPIILLQAALVAALRADTELAALVGTAIFDAPPRGAEVPYVAIARHDLLPRDGDVAPGFEHRITFHLWAAEASRRAVLVLADRVLAVALAAELDGGLRVTLRQHERTDTAIELDTGRARAAVAVRMFSEPGA